MAYGVKHVVKDALTGTLVYAPKELADKRLALCQVCPHRRENIPGREEKHKASNSLTPWSIEKDKCNLCGCYMPVKTKLMKASCPVKKW